MFAFLFLLLQLTISHQVTLDWQPYPSSTPTNTGWYNVYRADKTGDYCVGTPTWIGHVQQSYANGLSTLPQYVDASVLAGKSYCYSVSFIYTPSGTSSAVESELSDALQVTVPSP